MANAVLETMDFEESALEAITYSCMCYPVFLSKIHIHTYVHTYIQTKMLHYIGRPDVV